MAVLVTCFVLMAIHACADGHGRMIVPPARATMWRYGFHTPINSDDMSLDCGGQGISWDSTNTEERGHCGVCGDPYNAQRRKNEAGGIYAKGIIGRHYKQGQVITVELEMMVMHGGWSEFRICPNNNIHRPVSQDCLDKYLLRTVGGNTRFYHPAHQQHITVQLQLPPGLTCTQCVLQWWWKTNSNNNCRPDTGKDCCIGCGRQEIFVNCADVDIHPGNSIAHVTNPPITNPPQSIHNAVRSTPAPPVPNNKLPENFLPINNASFNQNIGVTKPDITVGFVPIDVGRQYCTGTDVGRKLYGNQVADRWCQAQCQMGICPASLCSDNCRV